MLCLDLLCGYAWLAAIACIVEQYIHFVLLCVLNRCMYDQHQAAHGWCTQMDGEE
jgi:hypothetical protein